MGLSNKLNVPSYRTVNNRIRDYHSPIISFSSIINFLSIGFVTDWCSVLMT